MSNQTKKKTVAQSRAEKKQRLENAYLGCVLADELKAAFDSSLQERSNEAHYDRLGPFLVQANRASELLKHHPNPALHARFLFLKGQIHNELAEVTLAVATFRRADEIFAAAEHNGLLELGENIEWRDLIKNWGDACLRSYQFEAAKGCFLRILAWPRPLPPRYRVSAFQHMANYYHTRKDWANTIKFCEEPLRLIAEAKEKIVSEHTEMTILLMLADAAESQGNMSRAFEYDERIKELWLADGKGEHEATDLVPCHRRDALQYLAAGKPSEAIQLLEGLAYSYIYFMQERGFNLLNIDTLQPVLAALKVLAAALAQTGISDNIDLAHRIVADVEETEAIVSGYWEGVLEMTRLELGELRKATAATAGSAAAVAPREEGTAMKKSKAAKRKQQKRKAQQQKKAEAAVVAATEGPACLEEGNADAVQGQAEEGKPAQLEQGGEEKEKNEEENLEEQLAAMALGGKEKKEEGEVAEEEGDECSVCFNAIDDNDNDNPAGLPLMCGHRYHAFCLHFWVERCTIKCIEPTCPYCRSPLQEMESR